MRLKVIKTIVVIVAILIIVLLVTMLIPIKFCVLSLPTNSDEDFYIIRYSRSRNRWILLGDKANGLYSEQPTPECIVRATKKGFGISPLSVDLFMQGDATIFIIYGTATIDESWDEKYHGDTGDAILYTIDSTRWEIFGKIETTNLLRRLFPKNYLNLYDYRWFDVLRDKLYGYLDGSTNF